MLVYQRVFGNLWNSGLGFVVVCGRMWSYAVVVCRCQIGFTDEVVWILELRFWRCSSRKNGELCPHHIFIHISHVDLYDCLSCGASGITKSARRVQCPIRSGDEEDPSLRLPVRWSERTANKPGQVGMCKPFSVRHVDEPLKRLK